MTTLEGLRDGATFDPDLDSARLNEQTKRVYAVLSDGGWHSLAHIERLTGDPQASISARIRDLRKERFGSHEVLRQRSHKNPGTWVYRLTGARIKPERRQEPITVLSPATTEISVPHLRTSERKDLKRCPQRWAWSWRSGLALKSVKPDGRWFGTGMHLALQERYKYRGKRRGKDMLKVWREYVGDAVAYVRTRSLADPGMVSPEDEWVEAGALGEAMIGAYLDRYGKDERWFVISAEQTFEIPIPRPGQHIRRQRQLGDTSFYVEDEPLVLYNGTFDLVALDEEAPEENSLWLWDHKNVASIQTNHLGLDDQAGSYWAVAVDVLRELGLIEPGMMLDGILYNFLRKAMPDARPRNAEGLATNKPLKAHYAQTLHAAGLSVVGTLGELVQRAQDNDIIVLGEPSARQPMENFHREPVLRTRAERRTQIERIQGEALLAEAYRTKALPIIKNPTDKCPNDCDFFAMCELHEQKGDWREFRDAVYARRDPYEDHRVGASTR